MRTKTTVIWTTAMAAAAAAIVVGTIVGDRAVAEPVPPVPEVPQDGRRMTVPDAEPATDAPADAEDEPVAADGPACEVASGEARLVSLRALCDEGCAPDAAALELTFDRVVDAEAVVERLRVAPAAELTLRSSPCARRVLVGGELAPQTEYRFSFSGRDGAEREATLATGGGNPVLRMPAPAAVLGPRDELPIQLEGVRAARLRLVPLTTRDIDAAAEIAGWRQAGQDALADAPARFRRRVEERAIDPASADEDGVLRVDPFPARARGLVLAVLDAPGAASTAAIVQRASHSVVLKVGTAGGLVWVADTRTGRPAARVPVTIYEGGAVRMRGRTDARGILQLPAADRLRTEEGWDRSPLRAVATVGGETSYATETFDTGIERWQLGLPYSHRGAEEEVRGMITAERGIYRPGESVHLLGILREARPDGSLRAPRGRVSVQVQDPDGTAVFTDDLRLTRFGTFRQEVEIPAGSRLGRYQVTVQRGDSWLHHRFEVGEFRANTFEVELPPAGEAERVDGDVVVPVSASYLYGAPVRGGTVEWTVSWRPQAAPPRGAERFSFGGERLGTHLRYTASDALHLDDDGQGRIVLPSRILPTDGGAQAVDFVVEATVRDAADDTVSARTVQHLSIEDTWLGLANDAWVVDAERGWDLSVVAVRPDGRRVTGEDMELRLIQQRWVTNAERGSGGVRYGGSWEEVLVATREVQSTDDARRVHFDLPSGGTYRVELWRPGRQAGRQAVASARVWARGEGSTVPVHNHPRIEILADRDAYAPGDRARLYAQVPWEDSIALVTVEREGVIEARVERLRGMQTPIDVRVTDAHAPNVYVGVTAIPVADGVSPASGVPLRVGYHELEVSPEERRLEVRVEPAETEHRPGDPAVVDVSVRDHRGRPVRAEVTLWAADEGVLSLTGYRTPDPFEPVYARRLHHVSTAASFTRWTQSEPHTWYEGGGDGAPQEAASALRSRFLSTAFFSRGVVTDRRGKARVRFDLPDNLTRWRVMAAVADRGERFGKGESAVVTSKPLQAMPSLPRFLTQDDLVDAGVVVHNHTGAAGTAEVRLEVDGKAELVGESVRRVELPDGGQVPVRFQLVAAAPGEVRVRGRVRMAGESDGFELALPIHPATAWSSQHLGEGTLDETAHLSLAMPEGLQPGQAELVVTVSQTVYASMDRGIEALVEYPHGCVEQTTSRLIPMVLLEELLEDMGSQRLAGADHRRRMNDAIAHVITHQNGDGGFGLWPTSSSEGFLTAYALWGLLTAKEHGYTVSSPVIERATAYLESHATHGTDMHGQFDDQEIAPFAAYVLAYARRSDDGMGRRLAGERGTLTPFSLGLLADAMTRREQGEAADPLFASIAEATVERGGHALVQDPGRSEGLMRYGSDVRATASAVQALVTAGRSADAGDLVAGILAERDAGGGWGTTYNNMWALYALTTYAETQNAAPATVPVQVAVGGRNVASVRLTPSKRAHRIVIPAAALPAGGARAQLTLTAAADTQVRYAARLRYVLNRSAQRPENQGFRVDRELLDAETGETVEHPVVGQLLRVRLTIQANERQRQVALVDRLPAGLEPVDTSLATTQRAVTERGDRWTWTWREIHDERVSFFADHLAAGTHHAEYLARATRSGEFVRPALTAENMYDPNVHGRGAVDRVVVARAP